MQSLRRLLAGDDLPGHRGLPANELLAPLPLLALGLLALNDWVLKGARVLPFWFTGKLSDFAGLFVFPLVATAVGDLALLAVARLGVPVDFTLRRWKLAVIIAITTAWFAAMKLSPDVAEPTARLISVFGLRSSIMADPTDLLALPVMIGTWFYGRRVIARGAFGRLELAARRRLAAPFADAAACGADPAIVRALDAAVAGWVAGGPPGPVIDELARLRA